MTIDIQLLKIVGLASRFERNHVKTVAPPTWNDASRARTQTENDIIDAVQKLTPDVRRVLELIADEEQKA